MALADLDQRSLLAPRQGHQTAYQGHGAHGQGIARGPPLQAALEGA